MNSHCSMLGTETHQRQEETNSAGPSGVASSFTTGEYTGAPPDLIAVETILESAAEGIYGLDCEGRTTFANAAAARMTGYTVAELLGKPQHALIHHTRANGEHYPREECPIYKAFRVGLTQRRDSEVFWRKNGTSFPVEYSSTPLLRDGVIAGAVVIFRDVSERKRAEEYERERNSVLESIARHEPLTQILDAIAHLVERQFPETRCRLRLAKEENPPSPNPRWSVPVHLESGEAPGALEVYTVSDRDLSPHEAGLMTAMAKLASLAIDHREMQARLQFQAFHDSLTGLANRSLFQKRLEEGLGRLAHDTGKLVLLYIDLDRFKQVNDKLGHRIGDLYLRTVSDRLRACVGVANGDAGAVANGVSNIVGRVGGDEFAVLAEAKDAETANRLAHRLQEVLSLPITIDELQLRGGASIGFCLAPDHGSDAETLQRHADAAMYRAKALGRNRAQCFEWTMASISETFEMEAHLRRALQDGEFALHYQPKFTPAGRFAGFEALLRWLHPVQGFIPPNRFIPLAEESGLIIPIGDWVLREACRQSLEWQSLGLPPVPIAVNISAVQFARANFAESVVEVLQQAGIDPTLLELELTESVLISNPEDSRRQMNHLRAHGLRLSIDDFGTGYSSLSYLHRLPIHTIKIDQSFVRDLEAETSSQPLVQAIISAAHSLAFHVVAEGVETERQRHLLGALGCDILQGYLFSRPLGAERAQEFLRSLDWPGPIVHPASQGLVSALLH